MLNIFNTEELENQQTYLKVIKKVKRKATILEIGGFRPSNDIKVSCFGSVNLSLPGEEWPSTGGKMMHALCAKSI